MKILTPIVLFLASASGFAQATNAPLNEDYYWNIDRFEIKSGKISPRLFTSVKPYGRQAIVAMIDSLSTQNLFTSKSDQFLRQFLRNDNWEWSRDSAVYRSKPIWKKFYRARPDLLHVDEPSFDLHVNPVLYLGLTTDSRLDDLAFINSRGIEIRGMIDKKIGFYTFLTDNQMVLPSYVNEGAPSNPAVPHEGFWKDFKTNGVDFLHARGYISVNASRHVNIQFGHDRTFIGNGHRSLIFSDFSSPQLFLRTQLKVWRLNYFFQVARLTAEAYGNTGGTQSGIRFPEKFMAFHHASFNIGKKLNLGFFESVIFSPKDSITTTPFDISYLNPVIFYRAIEQQPGSRDNVILGADFKWIIARGVSLYGQVIVDEFLLSEVKAGDGWWANKFAFQGGLKLIDVAGIPNLDILLEANVARPYTYAHSSQYGSYSHYNQPLAHPLGANFNEGVAVVRYQPIPLLKFTARLIMAKKGLDDVSENWGGDILKNTSTRQSTYGNSVAQGNSQKIFFADLTGSYMLQHNLFIDLKWVLRQSRSPLPAYDTNTSLTSLALRWNIPQRSHEF